jgi:glycosyltransferase involved in cell wall biosynthesis
MKIAVLSPVAWRTPPRKYGPWEQVASNVAEGLVALGHEVTLFATGDSMTKGHLSSVVPTGYEETPGADAKVMEYLHIGHAMEQAGEFDVIHNHFDFMPLVFSPLIKTPIVTTIHGFSSQKIIPVYKRYNGLCHYVSISDSDRSPELRYAATVYNGLDTSQFSFCAKAEDYLLFFGRIHPDKGTYESIQIAKAAGLPLIISGLVQDASYFEEKVKPYVDGEMVSYVGNSGPEQRNSLLGKALALLHPIHFEEPFGLSVVESMLCGTPVIAFNKGSMPELIKHGETGFLVNNTHEAAEAVHCIGQLNREVCHRHARENFSQEKMVQGYVKVYN